MIQMKFSHEYYKMPWGIKEPSARTWLIGVFKCDDLNKLPDVFLEWDTVYPDGQYELDKKKPHLILMLFTCGVGIYREDSVPPSAWQTIRSWNPEKESYYKSHVGEEVEVVFT